MNIYETDVERSSSISVSCKSRMTTSQMLKEADKRRRLRREKRNRKRATVMITSGAMTFLVMAATLVMASFLMSPIIERIFGGWLKILLILVCYVFVVVDKLGETETGLEETTAGWNCSLAQLYRQEQRCRNMTQQVAG